MGRLIARHDWSSTSLGPAETWSVALRTTVATVLASRFPMLLVWGPDLVKIYNDGYRPLLGHDKHPHALGTPVREVWPEIWDVIGPMLRSVMTDGTPTWSEHELLLVERNGFAEECYFTWSYGPVRDDDGEIRGVLDVVTETTDVVLSQRRLACVAAVTAALVGTEHVTDVCVHATSALARSAADIRAADLYLLLDDELALVSSNRRGEAPPVDLAIVSDVARTGEARVLGGAEWDEAPADHAVVPVIGAGGDIRGAMVATLNVQRPFDAAYRSFVHLVAGLVGTALEGAYRRSEQLGLHRQVSETLQRAMLTPTSDLPTLAARYLPAVDSLAVGGDWYDLVELGPDRRALVVGDCVGHGLAAATVMSQLRSAARAMLLDGRSPSAVLEGLDAFAAQTPGAACTTVAVAIIDREAEVVTYSRAGHPPPLVVGAGGGVWLDAAPGLPLAVDPAAPRSDAEHELAPDDLLILYSDGLVERPGEIFDTGLARLLDAATTLHGASVHDVADGLIRALLPPAARDDVVLVVKHLPDRSHDRPVATAAG